MTGTGNEQKLCDVCGVSFGGWLVRRCECGALVHAYCWEKHVLRDHRPDFEYGFVTTSGEFKRDQPGTLGGKRAKNQPKDKLIELKPGNEAPSEETQTRDR